MFQLLGMFPLGLTIANHEMQIEAEEAVQNKAKEKRLHFLYFYGRNRQCLKGWVPSKG